MTIDDTICALSTAPGVGAIAVIRLSGSDAIKIVSDIFIPGEKGFVLNSASSHTVHFGRIGQGTSILDEVLVSVFRAPHSYTGEDVVEISCHGSVFIQQRILELLIVYGGRLAKPGEFTLRAFLNKKFDLSQAEAVADLIASHSQSSNDLAIGQMRGGFSKKIKKLRQQLIEITALIELELDFSEEHVEFADRSVLTKLLSDLENEISTLVNSFSLGNVLKHGIPVAIIGKPNVGKSTLLNVILNEEKAIVSEIPGTTRDAIEDTIVIGGYSFRFIDTAGLREAADTIENMGIERTFLKVKEASIILYVFDATKDSFEKVKTELDELLDLPDNKRKHVIMIGNKTDKLNKLPKGFKEFVSVETIFVSAKRKENIQLITDSLLNKVREFQVGEQTVISNSRHYEALQQALKSILSVEEELQAGISPDLLTIDIRNALYYLGEITGEITTDEILGTIFSRFCIGK